MSDEILISAENVSKKFCRSLKRSLWYGVQDVASALNPFGTGETANSQLPTHNPDLRKDEFWAVRDVSFELRRGECLGLIGHNGAGKSTLLKILNGLIRPDTGRITMRGRVAALIELNAGFNPILTGRENIFNQASLLGFTRQEMLAKFDAIIDFAEIGEFLDMPVQNYSSGMKVRLGFAVAAQMEPDILIIDEVLAVGDNGFRIKCLNTIAALLKNTAVIFVSHTMPQVHRICTQVMLLSCGKPLYHGHAVGVGVNKYLELFSDRVKRLDFDGGVAVATTPGGDCKDAGKCRLEAYHGEPMALDFYLISSIFPLIATVTMVVWNDELLPVACMMDCEFSGYPIRFADGNEMRFRLEIDNLTLLPGRYSFSVHIASLDKNTIYADISNICDLVVKGGMSTRTSVLIPSRCQFQVA